LIRAIGLAVILLTSQAEAAEVGIASTFYDHIVACPPKRIDPYKAWGIAHKTLPCGTLVEIENMRTHLKTIAPVVDVGPCTSVACQAGITAAYQRARKRRFDLLPRVARKIGSDGLTRVSVRIVN